jgi:hypothetical protein
VVHSSFCQRVQLLLQNDVAGASLLEDVAASFVVGVRKGW